MINSLDDYFSWYNIENPEHVAFAKKKLKGSARDWWHKIDSNKISFDRPPIIRCTDMCKKLEDKYLLPDCKHVLIPYTRGTLSVDDYTTKFRKLNIRCKVNEADFMTINYYRNGLHQEIRGMVMHNF